LPENNINSNKKWILKVKYVHAMFVYCLQCVDTKQLQTTQPTQQNQNQLNITLTRNKIPNTSNWPNYWQQYKMICQISPMSASKGDSKLVNLIKLKYFKGIQAWAKCALLNITYHAWLTLSGTPEQILSNPNNIPK
jgi:hypothetical protein